VTGITRCTCVRIARNLVMVIVYLLLIVVFVAINTTEQAEVTGHRVAIYALVPLAVVFSAINGEIHVVVVKCSGLPCIFAVAVLAGSRELGGNMVGVVGRVIIGHVAAIAGIGRIDVVAVVADRAIIGYGRMGAVQLVIAVVNGEGSRTPVGRRGMAHIAIGWNAQRQVVGIQTLVVIGKVTAFASVGGIVVVALVAQHAVVGYGDMRSCKRIHAIVVEGRRHPGILGMALLAICRELPGQVVGVGRRVVIRRMAPEAGIRGVVVVAVVAFGTIVGDQRMRAAQHVIVVVYGERSRHPVGRGSVAHVAIVRNAQRSVWRICTLAVIGHMASFTGIGGIVVIALMTYRTVVGYRDMRTGEWVHRIVIEGSRAPGVFRMAEGTIRGKLCAGVVRVGRHTVIRRMAAVAGIGRVIVIAVVAGGTVVGDGAVGSV